MKNIVLIILVLTLISCGTGNSTGNGDGNGGGIEDTTPEGIMLKAWASKVGGKTFIEANNKEIKFNSKGYFKEVVLINEAAGQTNTITTSIEKVISANKVILKIYTKFATADPDIYGEDTSYICYELDEAGLLLSKSEEEKELSSINLDDMQIKAFSKEKFEQRMTWLESIKIGSIFISEELKIDIAWGDNNSETNTVKVYGYLRIGELGRIDGKVPISGGEDGPGDYSKEDTEETASRIGKIGTGDIDDANRYDFESSQSHQYINGDHHTYVLNFKDKNDGTHKYNFYSFEYNSGKPDTIKFISASDITLKYMPKGTVLKLSSYIVHNP